uniref:Ig-like domain-containing protein n=1 Tax=Terrapene triunguis TaxID=2587831 RepID=A0A674IZ74_9SAUR
VTPLSGAYDRASHDGLTTLFCKVSGFYPRDITVTWLRNGESRQQETYSEGILPSGDGTYQTWVTMEIDPKIKAHYSCHVEHESLLEPLSITWGKEFLLHSPGQGGITAGILTSSLVICGQTRSDPSERDAHSRCKVSKGWRHPRGSLNLPLISRQNWFCFSLQPGLNFMHSWSCHECRGRD